MDAPESDLDVMMTLTAVAGGTSRTGTVAAGSMLG